MLASILTLCGLILCFNSCGTQPNKLSVAGTLEPLPTDSAPSEVLEVIEQAERFHPSGIAILSDTLNDISVMSIEETDKASTDGYGVIVMKGAGSTTFPNISHARKPEAVYDNQNGNLWLTSNAVAGTGVNVDWLYQIRFDEENKASIAHIVNPYDIQQQLCQRLGYTIEGQDITLWDDTDKIATFTNTITDMGGFDDENPVWIGDQIAYDLTDPVPHLLVTPGIKFITGLVLTYDDTPTLTAPLTIDEDGTVSIGKLTVKAEE